MKRVAVALATVGGVGYVPLAPGTFGSLVTAPFLPALAALRDRAPLAYAVLVVAVAAVAVWAAGVAEEVFGEDDSQIVVDEVAGLVVAGIFLPATWLATGVAFVLFRVFDVVKPWPASFFDGRVERGLGVVGDDLVAGAYAGLATSLLLGLLP